MTQIADAADHAASDPKFVEKTWREAGVTFPPISAEVDGEPCTITSITARPAGSTYVNLTIGDEKKSLIAANHSWTRGQQEINDSAFFGVLAGAPAETALHYEPGPRTIAEARTKDRAKAVGRRYFVRCKEGDDSFSWRMVSGVVFGDDYFDAISHFDWGETQRFAFDIVSEVVDAQTDAKLSLEEMRDELARRPKATMDAAAPRFNFGLVGLFFAAALGAGVLSYFLLDRVMPPAKTPEQKSTGSSVPDSRPAPGPQNTKANDPATSGAATHQPPAAGRAATPPRRGRTNPSH